MRKNQYLLTIFAIHNGVPKGTSFCTLRAEVTFK